MFFRWRLGPRRRSIEGRLRSLVSEILALGPRAFVRNDRLILSELVACLRLEWRARDIHPWDRDLPVDQRAERFREQTLSDTDAAIERLFRTMPEIETVEIRVVEPRAPNAVILSGTVARKDVLATREMVSPLMRLMMMGIQYQSKPGVAPTPSNNTRIGARPNAGTEVSKTSRLPGALAGR